MELEEGEEAGTGSAQKVKEENAIRKLSPVKSIQYSIRFEESRKNHKSPSKKSEKSESPSSRSRRKQGRVSYARSSSP